MPEPGPVGAVDGRFDFGLPGAGPRARHLHGNATLTSAPAERSMDTI